VRKDVREFILKLEAAGLAVEPTSGHMSISLDGFVAGPDQSLEHPLGRRGIELHRWHLWRLQVIVESTSPAARRRCGRRLR
jgi:hypothetical protein